MFKLVMTFVMMLEGSSHPAAVPTHYGTLQECEGAAVYKEMMIRGVNYDAKDYDIIHQCYEVKGG